MGNAYAETIEVTQMQLAMEELYHNKWAKHWGTLRREYYPRTGWVKKDDQYEALVLCQREWVLGREL